MTYHGRMSFLQIKIQTTELYVETISTLLNLLGAKAVTFQDAADEPVLEPALNTTPIWQHTFVIGLFEPQINAAKIETFLRTQLDNDAIISFEHAIVAAQNWERAWLKDFHPVRFGKNLWVCPSVETPPDPNAVNIILDPGLAFGTGTHPTTALCLEWLDAHPPKNELVVDYGCGSGILAIAALKLGAKEVWAVDHDEQALDATLLNAQRNSIEETNLHTTLPEHMLTLEADTLLANILANPLITLAHYLEILVKPGGNIVLSGILETQAEEVSNAYAAWFNMQSPVALDGWVRLTGIKK